MASGKRILVTGGSSGIGAAIVETLGTCGASLGIHCHANIHKAQTLLRELPATTLPHQVFQEDLVAAEGADRLMQGFLDAFGGIDVLVNNAGWVFGNTHFQDLDLDDWDRTFSLNARAPFLLSRRAFAVMQEQDGGKIINISSVSAKYGGSAFTMHYGASKAALEALTVGFSRAGAKHNILVNAIRCGFIDTEFHRKMGRTEADIHKRTQLIPLKRAGKPEDVAQAVAFLVKSSGDFVTGETLTIAGGD